MALVKLTLTFAERHLCSQVLNDLDKVELAEARNMRELARVFDLRTVRREVEDMAEIAMKTPGGAVRWLDILDWEEEHKQEPRTFTIDEGYTKWLQGVVENKDWNRVVVRNPQTGDSREETMSIPLEQGIAIAGLMDALQGATPVKGDAKEK